MIRSPFVALLTWMLAAPASAQLRLSTEDVDVEFNQNLAAPISTFPPAAYRGLYVLHVDGERYYLPFLDIRIDGPFLRFPEVALGSVRARREVYVPPSGGNWLRIVDVLENPGAAAVTVRVEERGNQGAVDFACVGSASGDARFDADVDAWAVTKSPRYPLGVGHVIRGAGSRVATSGSYVSGESLVFGYDVTIPAGGRVAILLFSVPEPVAADAATTAVRLSSAPEAALLGLDELRDDVVNWDISRPGIATLSIAGPAAIVEGDEARFRAIVSDPGGATLALRWDLDDDGLFGEGVGSSEVTVPSALLDGPSLVPIWVEADDPPWVVRSRRVLEVVNAAPRFAPVEASDAEVGVPWSVTLSVSDAGGAADPLTLELLEAPTGMVLDGVVLRWTPSEDQVTEGSAPLAVRVRALDDEAASAFLVFGVRVTRNHLPGAPRPAHPLERADAPEGRLRVIAENAIDLDGDALTYEFELDEREGFLDPRRSGPIAEGAGFTATSFEGLDPSRTYAWRVRARDAEGAGPWAVALFSTRALDAGGADGGVAVASSSGGCGVTRRGAPLTSALALLVLFMLRRKS